MSPWGGERSDGRTDEKLEPPAEARASCPINEVGLVAREIIHYGIPCKNLESEITMNH